MPNKACGFYLLHLCVCAEYWTYGSLDLRMDAIPRCNFYLAESLIPGAGRAILAGKHFRIGDSLFDLPTLAFKKEYIENGSLITTFTSLQTMITA